MTIRDERAINTLYYFHRYIPSSIAKLYRKSPRHIINILMKGNKTVVSEVDCQICGSDECQAYFIDGDSVNNKPQNIIMLCEPDKRKFQHLKLQEKLVPQMED